MNSFLFQEMKHLNADSLLMKKLTKVPPEKKFNSEKQNKL